MQKKIIALAIAGLASTAAFAQTNVTIYGIADAGLAYSWGDTHNDQINVVSGGLSGSRIGFKGTEDLGNGLKALFVVEYGVELDKNSGLGDTRTGAGMRQGMVGVTSGFGTAVIGRLQTTGYDFACATSPIGGSALDANHKVGVATVINCSGAGRADNAVAYISPTFGGLSLAVNHARLSELEGAAPVAATATAAGAGGNDASATLASATYNGFGLNAQVVYSYVNATTNAFPAGTEDFQEYGVRASYDLKVASLFGSWQASDAKNAANNYKWSAGVAVPIGKATIVGQYAGNDINGTDLNSSAFTLAATYGLSKRTTIYGGYSTVLNDDKATKVAGFTGAARAGDESSVVAAGVRHAF